jgi:hypothetical protein
VKRRHAEAIRTALIVLVGSLVVAAPVAADAPAQASVAVTAPVAAATADLSTPAAATPRARDHLLELVAEYLEVAFARDANGARTAQLEPLPVTIVQ